MTLEEYKKKVKEELVKAGYPQQAEFLMKEYDEDMETFLKDGWSPLETASAMEMGY